jgi:hypothetical protein
MVVLREVHHTKPHETASNGAKKSGEHTCDQGKVENMKEEGRKKVSSRSKKLVFVFVYSVCTGFLIGLSGTAR